MDQRLREWVADEFLDDCMKLIIDSRGKATVAKLKEEKGFAEMGRWPESDFGLTELLKAAASAKSAWEEYAGSRLFWSSDVTDLISRTVPAGDRAAEVHRAVVENENTSSRPPVFSVRGGVIPPFPTIAPLSKWPPWRDLLSDLTEDEMVLATSTREIERLDRELGLLERPTDLGWLAASFAWFLSSGVLLPLLLMAAEPVPSGPWVRGLAVALFVSGIAAIAAALLVPLRRTKQSLAMQSVVGSDPASDARSARIRETE